LKKISFIFVFVAFVFSCLPAVNAATLNVELLYPDIFPYQFEFYAYTRGGSDLPPITGENRSYELSFYADGSDNFLRGTMESDRSDFINGGDGEVLMTGPKAHFGWENIENPKWVLFDFIFDFTGGALASEFESGMGETIARTDNSDFAGGRRANHQTIKVSHDTTAVNPIPATAWLLGAGLIAMVALRRKFNG
jgi:hypothetical protein